MRCRRSGRPRASRSIAGRNDSSAWPSSRLDEHVEGQPGAGLGLRVGTGVADRPHEVHEGADLGLGGLVAGRLARPAGDDQQLRVAGAVRQRLPQPLGDERHHRMEQAQVGVERLHQRPPGGLALRRASVVVREAHLGELEAPVAELTPDGVVQEPRDLAEVEVGHRAVHGRDGRRRHATAPSGPPARGGSRPGGAVPRRLGSSRAGRPARIGSRSTACWRSSGRSRPWPARTAGRCPGVVPWTRAKRRASAPTSSIVPSGSTVLPFVFDIFWPYGSRIRPDR